MLTSIRQSQSMSGLIRMNGGHQQAKQAEHHIQALPCNGTAVVQCLTGLWVFQGLHKGVDQGQTACCPRPVYDLPTSLRKAMQNLCTMNSLSNSEHYDLLLRYQLSAMQPPALTRAVYSR